MEFDTEQRTISMPQRKINKAQSHIMEFLHQGRAAHTALQKLLCSLRHAVDL